MSDELARIIDGVIVAEGGYVNHPDDRGGATMYGITEAEARRNGFQGHMRDLPKATAFAIYWKRYVVAPGFASVATISLPVAAELIDTGVNMGQATASKFLQRSLNALNMRGAHYPDVVVDGDVGPGTLAALKGLFARRGAAAEPVLLRALNALQGARYIELSEGRAANESFTFGWLANRVGMA